jgi:hypothetical protein
MSKIHSLALRTCNKYIKMLHDVALFIMIYSGIGVANATFLNPISRAMS